MAEHSWIDDRLDAEARARRGAAAAAAAAQSKAVRIVKAAPALWDEIVAALRGAVDYYNLRADPDRRVQFVLKPSGSVHICRDALPAFDLSMELRGVTIAGIVRQSDGGQPRSTQLRPTTIVETQEGGPLALEIGQHRHTPSSFTREVLETLFFGR
jgi:hypothetical protein